MFEYRNIIKKVHSFSKKVLNKTAVPFERECDADVCSQLISELIDGDNPGMVARFGSTELMCMMNYWGIKHRPSLVSYLLGNGFEWWWTPNCLKQIEQWSGFFPAEEQYLNRFCELMIESSRSVDILVSWQNNERYFEHCLTSSKKIQGLFLDPFWATKPWTSRLKGKKVLVIHPFANLIKKQYIEKRTVLFENSDILPEFEISIIKAVQSLGGENNGFNTWFDALQWMESEMDKIDYDVALIGCGAYGFPLAAYAKSKGKKAIHVGGSLQLIFGIKGKRWEDPMYGAKELGRQGLYPSLFNRNWVYPGEEGKPKNADKVEGACYW